MDKATLNAILAKYNSSLSDDNYAGVEIRGLFINLQPDEDFEGLCLYSALGNLPDPIPSEAAEELLTANLLGTATSGGHIGLYPPTRTLVYSCRFPLLDKSPDFVDALLAAFVDHVFGWVERLDKAHLEKTNEEPLELSMVRDQVLWG